MIWHHKCTTRLSGPPPKVWSTWSPMASPSNSMVLQQCLLSRRTWKYHGININWYRTQLANNTCPRLYPRSMKGYIELRWDGRGFIRTNHYCNAQIGAIDQLIVVTVTWDQRSWCDYIWKFSLVHSLIQLKTIRGLFSLDAPDCMRYFEWLHEIMRFERYRFEPSWLSFPRSSEYHTTLMSKPIEPIRASESVELGHQEFLG